MRRRTKEAAVGELTARELCVQTLYDVAKDVLKNFDARSTRAFDPVGECWRVWTRQEKTRVKKELMDT